MRPSVIVCFVAFLLAFSGAGSYGAINPILNYQGSLADSNDVPYPDAVYQLTFRVYADSVSGTVLWSETLDLQSSHGLVHAYLGEKEPFPADLFESYPLYLGITEGRSAEFKPRLLIASSVYSFLARNSQYLDGHSAEHFADTGRVAAALAGHNSDPAAHHPMQIDAEEIVTGVLDPNRIPPQEVTSEDIVDGTVSAVDLADSVITGSKLAADAIQPEHISNSAVTSDKVADGSLLGDDMADSTITSAKIASAAVGQAQIAPIAITGDKIATGVVAEEHLADSSVTSSKIATGAIHSEHLSVSAFSGANIDDGSITGVDLADSTVTSSKIASGSIHHEHLSVSAFSGANIDDGTITEVDLADSTVSGQKIHADEIGLDHLKANSVDGSKIVNESITGADIDDFTIGSSDIGGGAINAGHIAEHTITATKVAYSTLTGAYIADGTLSTADFGPSSVGTVQIIDNTVTTDDIADNTITSADCKDEPGLDYTSASILSSVGTTITNWMSTTISAPAPGYIIAFFGCIANIAKDEIAQTSICTSPTTFGSIYGEARIASSATSVGANMTITISEIIPVTAAGDVTVYANVRAAAASAGLVDFYQGHLQAVFIRSGY